MSSAAQNVLTVTSLESRRPPERACAELTACPSALHALQRLTAEGRASFPADTGAPDETGPARARPSGTGGTPPLRHHHHRLLHHRAHGEHRTQETELTTADRKAGLDLGSTESRADDRQDAEWAGAPHRRGHEDAGTARRTGLTHRFTHSHTIILRLKIVPVAAAATIYKAHALPLGEVEVPAGHHGPARPRQRLLGADSCVETVRRSAGRGSGFGASQSYRPARGEGLSDARPQ